MNKVYKLDDSVFKVVETQEIIHTSLSKIFNETLYKQFKLKIRISDLDDLGINYLCLFLHYDSSPYFFDKYHSEYESYMGVIYPKKKLTDDIISLLKSSVQQCNMPELPDNFSAKIMMSEFYSSARSAYFNLNIAKINRMTQIKFSECCFYLRFSRDTGNPGYYYLIFSNVSSLEEAKEDEKLDAIIDYINSICISDDKLGIFKGYKAIPIVTDEDTLRREGKLMGIIRENPHF